jgi:hypothetical protein
VFSELYDYISMMFSWRWPEAEGKVTALRFVNGLGPAIDYRFSLGEGSYTGEASPPPWHSDAATVDVTCFLHVGQSVRVRYRRDDPSVNTLDGSVWQDLEGL